MASLVVGLGSPEELGDEGPEVLDAGEVGNGNLPTGRQLLHEGLVGKVLELLKGCNLGAECIEGKRALSTSKKSHEDQGEEPVRCRRQK